MNVSYKIFMTLVKDCIENHLMANVDAVRKEVQTRFRKGVRLENNL